MNKTTEQGNQGKEAFWAILQTHLAIAEIARIMEYADDDDAAEVSNL